MNIIIFMLSTYFLDVIKMICVTFIWVRKVILYPTLALTARSLPVRRNRDIDRVTHLIEPRRPLADLRIRKGRQLTLPSTVLDLLTNTFFGKRRLEYGSTALPGPLHQMRTHCAHKNR